MIWTLISYAAGFVVLVVALASLLVAHGRDIAIDAAEIAIEADPRICADCTRRNARLPLLLGLLLGSVSLCVAVSSITRGRWPEPMALRLARYIVRTESPGFAVQHAPGAVRHGDDDEASER